MCCYTVAWGIYCCCTVAWESLVKNQEEKDQKQKYTNRFSIQFYCYPNGSVPCSTQDVNLFVSKCEYAYFYQAEIVV